MLQVVGGQNAEQDRNACVEAGLRDALADFGANVVVVAGASANHRSDANDRVVLFACRHLLRDDRNFKRARNPSGADVLFDDSVADKAVNRSVQKLLNDERVEARRYDSNLHVIFGNHFSFNQFHIDLLFDIDMVKDVAHFFLLGAKVKFVKL